MDNFLNDILKLLLIIVLLCGPIVLAAKILQWLIQFSVGGGLGRMMGGMMGQLEGKAGGGFKKWTDDRRGQTQYGLKRQLSKSDRQQQRVSKAVGQIQNTPYNKMSRGAKAKLGGLINKSDTLSKARNVPLVGAPINAVAGMSERDQRIQQQLMTYQAEESAKQLGNYNSADMQALAEAGGDVTGARTLLQNKGLSTNTVEGTAQALQSVGMMQRIKNNDTSVWNAIGNISSSRGELSASYADEFRKITEESGNPNIAAVGAGMAQQWMLQAKKEGEYSVVDPNKIRGLKGASGSDAPSIPINWANSASKRDTAVSNAMADLVRVQSTGGSPEQIRAASQAIANAESSRDANRDAMIQHFASALNASRTGSGGGYDPRILDMVKNVVNDPDNQLRRQMGGDAFAAEVEKKSNQLRGRSSVGVE